MKMEPATYTVESLLELRSNNMLAVNPEANGQTPGEPAL